MKWFPSRLFFASLTFIIGISLTAFWIVFYYPKSNLLFQSEIVYDSSIEVKAPEIKKEAAVPVNNYEPSDIVMIVSDTGGLVADDNNFTGGRIGHSELVITRDGTYLTRGDINIKKKGVLQTSELDDLIKEINNADFTALQSEKSIEDCPSARDETNRAYTFYTPTGIENIDSCGTIINANSALFVKVFEILSAINKQ